MAKKTLETVKAVLLDLDGTVYMEGKPIPGAKDAIHWLLERKIAVRFVTNSTLKNRSQIQARVKAMGFEVPKEWFFTPARCAFYWLKINKANEKILALISSDLRADLGELNLVSDESASVILVGDMGTEWDVQWLNKALRCLQKGATFTGLAQNRFWASPDGSRLDVGAFIAALEYASNKKCKKNFGKPDPIFFEMALSAMGVPAHEAIMVGDDLESDVLGAQACGIHGIQVETGKFESANWGKKLKQAGTQLESLAALPQWVEKYLP